MEIIFLKIITILEGKPAPTFKKPPVPKEFTEYYSKIKGKIADIKREKLPEWVSEDKKILKFIV